MTGKALKTMPEENHWRSDDRLIPAVNLIKQRMKPEELVALEQTVCFGLYHIPGEGECPEAADCGLSGHCKQVYTSVSLRAAESTRLPPRPASHSEARPLAAPSLERRIAPKSQNNRNKWFGTDKYKREGYVTEGRPVDLFLAAFNQEMGDLPKLPLIWNAAHFDQKFGYLGMYTVSATASYHAVLREGCVLCRVWTNTVRQAIVDITPDLVAPLYKASERLGTFRYRKQEILQLEPPHDCPPGSWMKVRPCTQRVIVRTAEAAREVARTVKARWKF